MQQVFGVVLHIAQHIADRVALGHVFDAIVAVFVGADHNRVRVAEKVVQIAENLLVRAGQEHAEDVVFPVERMQLEGAFDVVQVDEPVDLAVRVAGDVGQDAATDRLLVESVNGHDREQLLDRPGVGHRLKRGEVAEIRVRQNPLEPEQLFRHVVHLANHAQNAPTQRPENRLGQRPLSQRQRSVVEQLHDVVSGVDGVVVQFLNILDGNLAEGLVQILDQIRRVVRQCPGHLDGSELG